MVAIFTKLPWTSSFCAVVNMYTSTSNATFPRKGANGRVRRVYSAQMGGATSGTPTLGIVIPIFNESSGLAELFRRLGAVLDGLPDLVCRVIFVNDGSTDDSLTLLLDQHRRDARFTVIDLSRNFGQQAAIAAGLSASRADATVVMDGDL